MDWGSEYYKIKTWADVIASRSTGTTTWTKKEDGFEVQRVYNKAKEHLDATVRFIGRECRSCSR